MWELSLNVPGLKGYAIGESQENYRVQENFTSIVFLSLKKWPNIYIIFKK